MFNLLCENFVILQKNKISTIRYSNSDGSYTRAQGLESVLLGKCFGNIVFIAYFTK